MPIRGRAAQPQEMVWGSSEERYFPRNMKCLGKWKTEAWLSRMNLQGSRRKNYRHFAGIAYCIINGNDFDIHLEKWNVTLDK